MAYLDVWVMQIQAMTTSSTVLRDVGRCHIKLQPGKGAIYKIPNIYTTITVTTSVFYDFEKAFELISPDVILDILAEQGIKGRLLTWLRDYLTNRKAYVKNDEFKSTIFYLLAGTPQGSILSPPLFNVVMDKILKEFDKYKDPYQPLPSHPPPTNTYNTPTIPVEARK